MTVDCGLWGHLYYLNHAGQHICVNMRKKKKNSVEEPTHMHLVISDGDNTCCYFCAHVIPLQIEATTCIFLALWWQWRCNVCFLPSCHEEMKPVLWPGASRDGKQKFYSYFRNCQIILWHLVTRAFCSGKLHALWAQLEIPIKFPHAQNYAWQCLTSTGIHHTDDLDKKIDF